MIWQGVWLTVWKKVQKELNLDDKIVEECDTYLKKAKFMLREQALNHTKQYYTSTHTRIDRLMAEKMHNKFWMKTPMHPVSNFFIYYQSKSGSSICIAGKSNGVKQHHIKDSNFSSIFKSSLISCVTHCTTDQMCVIYYKKECSHATCVWAVNDKSDKIPIQVKSAVQQEFL